MARIAQHNLPIDIGYTIIDFDIDSDNYTTCDNCNRVITNVAFIRDANGKNFKVGLNCSDTLTSEAGTHLKEAVETKIIKKELSILRQVKKLAKEGLLVPALEILEGPHRENWSFTNEKGSMYMHIQSTSPIQTAIILELAKAPEIYDDRFAARHQMWNLKYEKSQK